MEVTYTIAASGLSVRVKAAVFGATKNAPFGFGWHPYFALPAQASGPSLLLRLAFASHLTIFHSDWNLSVSSGSDAVVNERMIPIGARDFEGFSSSQVSSLTLDNCFQPHPTGQFIRSRLECAATNTKIELWQDRVAFPFVQIYTPPHQNSIAIEPVSAAINAFNSDSIALLSDDKPYTGEFGVSLVL